MGKVISINDLSMLKDDELVRLVRDNCDIALDYLMNKYKPLVEKKSKSYYLIGASKDDIIQEGMIGLFKAIRDYKAEREASFYSFAELCITRQMISAVKASTRKKHSPLNSYISLNKPVFEEEDENTELLERVPSNKIINPEDVFIGKENKHIIERQLEKRLSHFENQVLKLYVDGVSYIEIAEIMDKPVKSIDNALQRIKKKVENIIKDDVYAV